MAGEIRDCLAPDRHPRKPHTVLPKGSIDTHVHVFEQGYTLRHIADHFGFTSITSVTNLMKTVVEIEAKMGRTSARTLTSAGSTRSITPPTQQRPAAPGPPVRPRARRPVPQRRTCGR